LVFALVTQHIDVGAAAAVVLGNPAPPSCTSMCATQRRGTCLRTSIDVTPSGDTETTLHDADPNQLYEKHSKYAAAAFADHKDPKDPYASPVYGDFSKGFPPKLIQGGLKETLLSGFVRLYQALGVARVPVKLDLYEGMIHNFQDRIPDCPESIVA
jgi:epsilon-lactone hydrolase